MKKLIVLAAIVLSVSVVGCRRSVASTSGIKRATVKVATNAAGHTTEQLNIANRLKEDNKPGSVKHLYVVNDRGTCILYSTVKGKVTSSGKRLSPYSISGSYSQTTHGIPIRLGDVTFYTREVIQDDGTFGSSSPYIYWWDHNGRYHQHVKSDAVFVHVSSFPIRFKTDPVIVLASQD